MILVGDIGGTNARFARVVDGAVCDVRTLRVADHASAADALALYLRQIGWRGPLARMTLAIAGSVEGDRVRLTNGGWEFSVAQLAQTLAAGSMQLLNDFEALAWAAPHLRAADLLHLGGGSIDARLPLAIIGPGTGLGVAGCIPDGRGGWIPLPTEGGHVTLAPANDFESDILRLVRTEYPHVSAERLISGIGLPRLHAAIATLRGAPVEALTPEEITTRALARADAVCEATLDSFCAMLGTVAGNLALTLGARGGVFLAGGIAQHMRGALPGSRFRERFEAKGRFASYLAPIATVLITAEHAALVGCAAAAAASAGTGSPNEATARSG
jgi:glucokinase